MARLHNTFFYGKWLGSGLKKGTLYLENFLSGFAGYGWKIWKTATGKWRLEIDEILVRGSMVIFEQLVSKIRALKGALFISRASGKIQDVTEDESFYYIVLEEDEMSFVAHDLIRCQNYSGKVKSYWVEVYAAENGTLTIAKSEFGFESGIPEIGDELAQCGNTIDTSRQSALYLHADEDGVPAFDVLEGISTKSFSECAIVRMGGILPGTENGRGLWCKNGKIFCTVDGMEVYSFNPDGSLQLGAGQIKYDPVTKKMAFGSGVTLGWNNLSQEAQKNLKGEAGAPGADGHTPVFMYYASDSYEVSPEFGQGMNANPNEDPGAENGWSNAPVSSEAEPYIWVIQGERDGSGNMIQKSGLYWTNPKPFSGPQGPKGERGIMGLQGFAGDQGVQGPKGDAGATTYFHIKYSNSADGSNMNEIGGAYIGTYVDFNEADSIDPTKYNWVKIEGAQGSRGEQGIQGVQGENGETYYLHIAYANSADGSQAFSISDSVEKLYIGQYVDQVQGDSIDYTKYKWTRIKGDQGNPGKDANLLPWVEEWNTNATEIGGESVVSPKMFSGTKDVVTGKLTGIAMGRECITINNVKRTGIFALVDDEVVFELDPITKKYKFKGEVNSTLGVFEKVLRVKTTSKIIETTESEDLSDDTGFNLNYAVSADIYEANHFAYLPVSQGYDGTQAIIANIGGYNSSGNWVGGGTLTIAAKDVVAGDSRFATNAEFKSLDGTTYGPTETRNAIFKIIVPYGGILRLWAFWLPYVYEENGQTINDSKLYWRIENPADFYITKATVDYGATSFYILQGRSGNW